MIPMRFDSIARALGALVPPTGGDALACRVEHDSRAVQPGDLFVAIRGERFDGHAFIAEAVNRGAVACLVDHAWSSSDHSPLSVPVIVVDDTVQGLGRLAAYYRQSVMSCGTSVVAVTGSNGKTTTKHMIHHGLSDSLAGRCSPKSFNNQIGVPLTILSTERSDRYVVVEVGMNAPGEIAALSQMALPDVAVISSIGEAHLLGLGTVDAIAREKASILPFVQARGLAVVNTDRPEIRALLPGGCRAKLISIGLDGSARVRVTERRGSLNQTRFRLEGRYDVVLNLPGVHHATNATAAFVVGRWFGLPAEEIIARLATFVPVEGRTRRLELGAITLIDDAYNANPASVSAAIDTLAAVDDRRRVLVLGDMFELGASAEELHAKVVERAIAAGIEVLIAVGPMTVQASRLQSGHRTRVIPCEDATAAGGALLAMLAPGDVVWVKGSRAMQLDRVVTQLQAEYSVSAAVA